ncbi:MAG: hypothetical protein AAF958_09790 [Planctomycetota bacterium]
MDDDAVILLLATTSTLAGAVIGKALPTASANMVVVVAVTFGVWGTVFGYVIVALRKKRRPSKTPRNTTPKSKLAPTSKTFRKRLADYTGQSESDVMVGCEPYKSEMPFWSAIDVFVSIPPKSARLIYRHLMFIRETLRGQRS